MIHTQIQHFKPTTDFTDNTDERNCGKYSIPWFLTPRVAERKFDGIGLSVAIREIRGFNRLCPADPRFQIRRMKSNLATRLVVSGFAFATVAAGAEWSIATVAGAGVAGFSGDGGDATAARLNHSFGVTRGPDGALWFCEMSGQRIRRITRDGKISTTAGNGGGGYSGGGGPALKASFNRPHGIFVDTDGAVFIADSEAHRIRALRKSVR